MKVAQVCPRFPPFIGGVETHVYEISKRLAKEFEVEVLTTDPTGKLKKEEIIDGVKVKRFKVFAPSNAYFFSIGLYRYLKMNSARYDVIHAHNYHAFPALFAALTKGSKKLVFTPHYHGKGHSLFRDFLHKLYRLAGRKIFNDADAIICVSEYEKELVLNNFDVDRFKIYVIPNGIDLDEFKNIDEIKKYKNLNEKIILYVGRLEKYKGVEYIVKALSKLNDEFTLEIVGTGPYKRNIVRLANRLGVLHRVQFFKSLSRRELIEKYAKADVLVLLSKYEAYGLVVAEALAAETPCIVASEAALREWVDDRNVFGVSYPPDIDKLARLIEEVAGKKIGRRKKVKSWDNVVEKLKIIYDINI